MTRRMQRAISNPEVGMPVLVSEGSIFEPKYALWTVSKAGEEEIVLSREGEKDLSITKTRLHDRGYEVVWTEALPDVPEDRLAAMLPMLEKSSYTNHVFLVKVEAIDGEGNYQLDLVGEGEASEDEKERTSVLLAKSAQPGLSIGDILLVRPRSTRDDQEPVMLTEAEIVITGMSEDQANDVLGLTSGPFQSTIWPVGSSDCFDIEIGHCMAKHDEDIVIAMVIDKGNIDRSEETHDVLHHQGSKLYWNDNLADELWGTPLDHGVWIGSDVAWYDAGDDGAEWEANWGRATVADMIKYDVDFEEFRGRYEDTTGHSLRRSDIKAMFAREWDLAPISEDDVGVDKDVGIIAREWIERLASKAANYMRTPELITESLETIGRVLSLHGNGHVVATATFYRDEKNQLVLTRWVEEDFADRLLGDDIQDWRKRDAE